MKFLHLSDLHIGLRLMGQDLREDQEHILAQIVDIAQKEQPQAVVIAGDIYDKAVPQAEATEVFDAFISRLSETLPEAEIMLISGNHDSAVRLDVFRSILRRHRIRMVGRPPQTPEEHIERVTLADEYGFVHFWLLPFIKPSMVRGIIGADDDGALRYDTAVRRMIERERIDESERNVLVSHQFYLPVGASADQIERMDSEIRTVGDIDEVRADILQRFDYAALGHIHKPMRVGGEQYRYCGTPLACSVSEAGQAKGVVAVELGEKGDISVRFLPLIPLRQVRIVRGRLSEVLSQASDDYVTVILTDRVDLDAAEMQDRLRRAFPHLLEIRREVLRGVHYERGAVQGRLSDPYEICLSFLGDLDGEEQEILRSAVNAVRERGGI